MKLTGLLLVPAGPPPEPINRMMEALRLDEESSRDQQADSPVWIIQSAEDRDRYRMDFRPAPGLHPDLGTQGHQSESKAGVDHIKVRRTTADLSQSQLISGYPQLVSALFAPIRWQPVSLQTKRPSFNL